MATSTTPQPGLLHVTMQPKPTLLPAQFHDWYNNEHGPGRLRYPFFLNGFRYRASDLPSVGDAYGAKDSSSGSKETPEWLAIYDVTDMAEMLKEPYVNLRMAPIQSQRERDTMKEIFVDRRFYDLLATEESEDFVKLEGVDKEGQENVMAQVSVYLQGEGSAEKFKAWYEKTDLPALKKLPGWTRSRYFKTATVDNRDAEEILLQHEFKPSSGFTDKSKFLEATAGLWSEIESIVSEKTVRTYGLWYTFGPAPRELKALEHPDYDVSYELTDKITKTTNAHASALPSGAVDSYVTTKDGARLHYRLEGSSEPHAPLIVLSNSILVNYGIWDAFLASFFSKPENKKYRIVRYLTRGRTTDSLGTSTENITVDLLASDIISLLDALRVPKAAAVIGVSLGGATSLCVGLKYPTRVERFIACDTSAKSPAGNSKAWSERIAIAEEEGVSIDGVGEAVGGKLAEITTKRWFVPESYDGKDMEKTCWAVNDMVKINSLEGFRRSVRALWEYDMTGDIAATNKVATSQKPKGAFLVGAQDGVLPKSMQALSESLEGSKFITIQGAGHLPMVEKPEEVAEAVTGFLTS